MMINNDMTNEIFELNDEALEDVTGGTRIRATGNVHIRRGPGLEFGKLGTLHKGDSLTYDGRSEKDERGVRWYRVRYNGSFGWVSSRYSKKV